METCIAFVTVQHLVRIIVEAAKTYLAVCLEKLLVCCLLTLQWLQLPLTVHQLLQLQSCLVLKANLEVFEDGHRHQVVPDSDYLFLLWGLGLALSPDLLY